ncbi:MAG: hypothetical protein HDR45_04975 [Bacteroides sp.]|nr:hypothetical protein [Bacteroides sp.]
MKRLLFLLLILLPVATYAKRQCEPVIAVKADGTRIEGFTKSRLINYLKPNVSSVSISTEPDGEETKFTSDEVVELIFPPTEEDTTVTVYHAVMAQKHMPHKWNKKPKTYDKPIFLRLIYNGDYVKGYARPAMDNTYTPSMTMVNYTWLYYYKLADQEITKAYWLDTKDIIPGMRKVMKFYFREFPGLQKMVDKKELTPHEFRANPSVVLPLMDAEAKLRSEGGAGK